MMRRCRLSSPFVLLVFSVGCGRSPVLSPVEEIRADAIRGHLQWLADDALEGRRTGTRGYDLAARYVRAQLIALGAKDGTGNGTYFQSIAFVHPQVDGDATTFELRSATASQRLRHGTDYALMDMHRDTESTISARVVFAGHGVSAPELGYDDYADIDVKDAIVAVYQLSAPAMFPPTVRAHYSSFDVKRATAARHGAVGLLYVRPPADEARMPWPGLLRELEIGWNSLRWVDANGGIGGLDDGMRILGSLNRPGAEALFTGERYSLTDVLGSAERGTPPRFAISKNVTIRARATHERVESVNVVAVVEGSDPALKDEYVLYTAHLDHLGLGPAVDGDSIYNGAMDNAGGCSLLLEVARAFSSRVDRPKRSIMFAFVTGEEAGLLGSDYFVRHPPVPIERIVADINVDGGSTLVPVTDVIAWGAEHSSLGATVQQVAGRMGFSVTPDPMPAEVIFVRSDQYSFVRMGVPAIVVDLGITSSTPGVDPVSMLTEWIATKYHSPKDDAMQAIQYDTSARFGRYLFELGRTIAADALRPRWNTDDFFGRTFAGR